MIELGGRGDAGTFQVEGDDLALGRYEAARQQARDDEGDGEKENEPIAAPTMPPAIPRVAV